MRYFLNIFLVRKETNERKNLIYYLKLLFDIFFTSNSCSYSRFRPNLSLECNKIFRKRTYYCNSLYNEDRTGKVSYAAFDNCKFKGRLVNSKTMNFGG